MSRNILSIITASFLIISILCLATYAAPSVAEFADSSVEIIPDAGALMEEATQEETSSWTGSVATDFGAGLGTADYPYVINTGDELALLAKVVNEQKVGFADAYYVLGDNIDLGEMTWTPIGKNEEVPFSGSFDGKGYSVSNFNLAESKYTGLFGYVLNGTIKNLNVNNFSIDLSNTIIFETTDMYVGGIAGYVSAKKGNSTISGVCVSQGTINVSGKIENLYVGNISGYAHSNSQAKTLIVDSYAANDITIINSTGYNYIGGIAGMLYTGSGSLSKILHCYSTGTISSQSNHSSRAGGLVGYLYSYGSAYAPSDTASLLASDLDIMIEDSFAASSIYSLSTKYTSYAGSIIAEANTHAGTKNIFYPIGAGVVIEAQKSTSTKKAVIDSTGTSTDFSNLKTQTYLSSTLGFDFENVWGISADKNDGYPYLLCFESEKAEITSVDINLGAKASESNIRYYEIGGLQYPLPERNDNFIKIVPSQDLLIEIVEKESADSINVVSSRYFYVDYETLTYSELTKLNSFIGNKEDATIKTTAPLSIRYMSKVSNTAKDEETDFVIQEYGFITAVQSLIDSKGSQLTLDFEKYAKGVAYNKKENLDLVFSSRDDDWCVFTGILINVPKEHYTTVVTTKTYTKITAGENDFVVYGEPVSASMYDIAKNLVDSQDLFDTQRSVLQGIITAVDGE